MNLIDKNFTYAVVGASRDQEKYGHKVFRDLLEAGYTVKPVNPNANFILGQKTYQNLNEINDLNIVIFVTPPEITLEIIKKAPKTIKGVWFQPGSESDEAIKYCTNSKIDYVANACIMVSRKNLAD